MNLGKTYRNLAGVSLSHSPEQAVGKSILSEVGESLIANLESGEVGWTALALDASSPAPSGLTGLGDGLLVVGLNGGGLVALGVDEGVVHDLHAGVLARQQRDLVGNGLGIGKGGNVLDVGEAHDNLVRVGSGQLGLGLVTKDDDVGVLMGLEEPAGGLGETGVDTAAEALVGAGHDEQGLLVLESLGLGVLEDLVGGPTVGTGFVHSLLGAGETGRGDDLHGVGDLLDVLDGLQAAFDLTQSREVGGIGRGSARVSQY